MSHSIRNPTEGLKKVMEAVCNLNQVRPIRRRDDSGVGIVNDYWATGLKMMQDEGFLGSLVSFDKHAMSQQTRDQVAALCKEEDFNPLKIQNVSRMGHALCIWVKAVDTYARVEAIVQPKHEEMQRVQGRLGRGGKVLVCCRFLCLSSHRSVA